MRTLHRTKPHALGMRPGFDATRLNRLVDELETDAYLERENPLNQEHAGGVGQPCGGSSLPLAAVVDPLSRRPE